MSFRFNIESKHTSQGNEQSRDKNKEGSDPEPEPTSTLSPIANELDDESSSAERKNEQAYSQGFLYRIYNNYSTSIVLENKGSVARDHLANERTYLAWLRTSISIITVGVAITQLFRLGDETSSTHIAGRPLGASFVALGIVYLFFALARYFHTQVALTEQLFPASRGIVVIGTGMTLGLLIAMFAVIAVLP